jgi:hypothetical protein
VTDCELYWIDLGVDHATFIYLAESNDLQCDFTSADEFALADEKKPYVTALRRTLGDSSAKSILCIKDFLIRQNNY